MDTSKIIKGVASGRGYSATSPIIKEDYGLLLKIEGIELPSSYEVDFSNSENSGSSVTMIGNADGVLIPRQFIDTGKDVFAFLYHVGADYGRTVYKFRIPNKLRPDRTDETPTPTQQSVIDQAIAALNTAVESTAAYAEQTAEVGQRAQDAQQAIEDMSVSATTLAEGESATVTKTKQDGVVHLEFGIPRGATGEKEDLTLWCVEDGVLKRHSHITKVMIETENDFELLNDFPSGTVAFLADYSKFWRKKTDGTWVEFLSSPASEEAIVGQAIVGQAVIGNGSEPEPERQLRTALYYDDDTSQYELIINEPIDGRRRDDPMFYQLIAEFPPLDDEHPYIFECDPENKSPNTYWFAYLIEEGYEDAGIINYVEIGSPIQPQSMANWFSGMPNLSYVSGLSADGCMIEGASLTDLSYMFYGCSSLSNADISGLDTSAVENMDNMFAGCNNLITITVGNSWSTESVTSSSGMFFDCASLVGGNGTTYDSEHVDAEYARIDTQETPGYFNFTARSDENE